MVSQEKLSQYVDIIDKYGLKNRVQMTFYGQGAFEVVHFIEDNLTIGENYFEVYGHYASDSVLKLYPLFQLSEECGIPPKRAIDCAVKLRNLALACQEINDLRIPFKTYESLEFVEALRKEYLRRGKRLNLIKENR